MPPRVVKSSAPTIDRPAVDQARTGDDPVGRDVATHERAQFAEGGGVQQVDDSLPGVELAGGAVFPQSLLAAHGAGPLPTFGQVVEGRRPIAAAVCHAYASSRTKPDLTYSYSRRR